MNKAIPLDEQETIINLSPAQVSKKAQVYSCMPNMVGKLRKYAKERPDDVQIEKDEGDMVFASVDRSWIKIAPKRRMSEEQRIAAAERLAKGRSGK